MILCNEAQVLRSVHDIFPAMQLLGNTWAVVASIIQELEIDAK